MQYRAWTMIGSLCLGMACGEPVDGPAGPELSTLQAFPGERGVVERGVYDVMGRPAVIAYERYDDALVCQGDMHLAAERLRALPTEEGLRTDALAALEDRWLWPDGVVVFTIDPALPDPARVHDAMAHWESETPIRFRERTTEEGYVTFTTGDGCSADLGHRGAQQFVYLAPACDAGVVVHEIGHTLGLWHEQSRSDRDAHVVVHWDRIDEGYHFAFQTYEEQGYGGQDVGAYDTRSVMHYHSLAFSTDGEPTITRRDGSLIEDQSTLSPGDIAGDGRLYACDAPFRDICDTLFEDDIVWLVDRGITRGCSETEFCPDRAISRAQMAAFLARALELPDGPDAFDDDDGNPLEREIDALANAGITGGCGERRFCPNALVSRAAMATFMANAFELPPGPDAFDDDGGVHEPAIDSVAAAGITNGCGPRRYCPSTPVSRAQMAAFLRRALTR